jgi:hypothetical protein
MPVAQELMTVGFDDQAVTGRQPRDVPVGGGFGVFIGAVEIVDQLARVELAADPCRPQDGVGIGRERKYPSRQVIVEGPDAKGVARAEEASAQAVPDGECEIALQLRRTSLAPALVRSEGDFLV